jgi:predicted phage terminase large subunit-like protein
MTKPKLDHLADDKLREILMIKEKLKQIDNRDQAQKSFLSYIKAVWDGFIEGEHHKLFARKLEAVARGKIKRLIVNMPPRHTKSEFASVYFPSYMMGIRPDMKIMQTTHTAELSQRFGRKVRNLMDTEEYKRVFDKVSLSADSKSAGRWETSAGGEYFAAGVGGAITGRGADLLIIDDPHSEQDAMSPSALESAYEWYTSGPRQRLQPGGSIVVVMTRWSTLDLTEKLIRRMGEAHADQWEVVELPAIFKREWWQKWENKNPPEPSYVLQSYDTAFSSKQTADYSAITTWGVFRPNADAPESIILLDAKRGRWDFPELKSIAYEEYQYWQPDAVLVESQASGLPLTHELRMAGIPVVNYRPTRGKDKTTRVHSVAPVFESGLVWAPDTIFADEVMEECAAFPYGEHDDFVDSMTQAILRFRQGNFISLYSDLEDEEPIPKERIYY